MQRIVAVPGQTIGFMFRSLDTRRCDQ